MLICLLVGERGLYWSPTNFVATSCGFAVYAISCKAFVYVHVLLPQDIICMTLVSCAIPVCAQEDKFSWASVNLKGSADRTIRGAGLEVLILFTKISLPLLAAIVRSSVCVQC